MKWPRGELCGGSLLFPSSCLFYPLSFRPLFAPSWTRDPAHRLKTNDHRRSLLVLPFLSVPPITRRSGTDDYCPGKRNALARRNIFLWVLSRKCLKRNLRIAIIKLPCVSFDLVEFGDTPRQYLKWVTFRVTVRLFANKVIFPST